jgi:hypothetical protein
MSKITQETFIDRSTIVHHGKYSYDKVSYINTTTRVKIICPDHGAFDQSPDKHLWGQGCPVCGGSLRSNTKSFIEKSIKIHGDRYDYSLVEYFNAHTYVKIICKIHGEFNQAPTHHLSGKNCEKCCFDGRKTKLDDFISRSNAMHNFKYDYSLVVYEHSAIKVKIICPAHGSFPQTPNSHLAGHGCPRCVHTTSSPEKEWLNSLNIPEKHITIKINKRIFKVDGFDPATNTIYEFYGDYWHGNPEKYDPEGINTINHISFGELYQKTLDKEATLKAAGYHIISIWENNWKKQRKETG